MNTLKDTAVTVDVDNEQVRLTAPDGTQIALSATDARRLARDLTDAAETIEGSEIYQKPLG